MTQNWSFVLYIMIFVLEFDFFSCEEPHKDVQSQIHALDKFVTAHLMSQNKQPNEAPPPFNASEFPDFSVFQDFQSLSQDKLQNKAICSACEVGFGYIMFKARDLNVSESDIRRTLVFICEFFQLGISEVCAGMIERYTPTLYYIVKNRRLLTSNALCGVMFQSFDCKTRDPYLEWTVQIPERGLKFLNNWKDLNSTILPSLRPRADRIKIGQLTDIHVDPWYVPGTNAECDNKVLCCHESHGHPTDESKQAGFYGDGRKCDSRISVLELTLKEMKNKHPDMQLFYMNGDIVPHNIWATEKDENIQIIKKNAELFSKYFPKMKVIPMLGNHEPHPVNFYSPHGVPENLSTTWVYEVSYEAYKQWIPDDQKEIYLKYGHYSVDINPTFRVLVMNTNQCYGFNAWQLYKIKDPGNELHWLIKELQKTEDQKQNVHLVGHVPPTHDECSRVWSRNFYKILIRYQHIIKGQFYGHTHYDEMKVLYHKGQPIADQWIAPSLTPYDVHNYIYRLYYADSTDYHLLDHETYTFNLKEANKKPTVEPAWYLSYSATKEYGITDLTPKSVGKLVDLLATDKEVFSKFYRHYHKINSDDNAKECAAACRQKLICGFVKSYYDEEPECPRLKKLIAASGF